MKYLALLFLLLPSVAHAHQVGVSTGSYVVRDNKLTATLIVAKREAEAAQALLPTGLDAVGCVANAPYGLADTENDGFRIIIDYDCTNAERPLQVDARFVSQLAPGHRHIATVGSATHVLFADATRFTVTETSELSWTSLITMGIEHILTGFDHLAFLLALVLGRRSIAELLRIVTAFTVAHSLSLACATLGYWTPPSAIVEAIIAASIIYVGLENIIRKDAPHRWRVAFAFGLIHGFGFAGALRELELPSDLIPRALIGFNLGVELGQLTLLVLIVPVLRLLWRIPLVERHGTKVASVAVSLAGLVWLVQRLA